MKNLEVKDAVICSGTCEACECKRNDTHFTDAYGIIVKFYASYYTYSQKTQSICCLVEKGSEEGSWSRREWFGLKYCEYETIKGTNKIVVSAPVWLLERKGILNLITKI
jgi:hypothetical protein